MNTLNEKTKAVVLDQFNEPLCTIETSAKNGEYVELFQNKTSDGQPINTITRKISRSQKNFKKAREILDSAHEYIHNNNTYYRICVYEEN